MRIYLDLVLLLNFLVDLLLLLGTNRLAGFPNGTWRCVMGAALGSVYAAVCLLPGFSFLGNPLWRLVSLGLIGTVAFGWNTGAAKRSAVFVLLNMAMGGIAMSFGKRNFGALVLCAGALWLLCRGAFGDRIGGREYLPVTLCWKGNQVSLTALRDSGNTLRDPVTGEQVMVVSGGVARKLTGLTEAQLRSPLETLVQGPVPGLRLIPCRTVGKENGMLLGLKPDKVLINERPASAVVAFAPEGLGNGSVYQALTGGIV